MSCLEVIEQAREVRDREQAEVWAEAVAARAAGVADKGKKAVLQPARGDIAFAPTAVKGQLIKWEAPVMNRDAPSVERT